MVLTLKSVDETLILMLDHIQLFRQTLSKKKCARDNPKGNLGYDEYFLTLKMSKLLLLLSFSTRKHTSMASRAILSNFFEKQ